MQRKIVVLDGYTLNPGDLDWQPIEQYGDLTVHDRSRGHVVERASGAAIVLTNKDIVGRDEIDALADLEYIGVLATGTNVVDLEAASERGIIVTNVPGYGPDTVAQHTFALLLELTNHVAAHASAVRDGEWSRSKDFCFTVAPLTELAGKTLAVIGLGAIGARVARIGNAMGMKVAVDERARGKSVERLGFEPEHLSVDELFNVADVLTLHCPLTEETRHLVNADRLVRMKPSALILNTGRGPLVDEEALAEALRAGRIAGVGFDVLSQEPPAADHPLIGCPRCIITPHVAWATLEARGRLMQMAADNIKTYLDGTPQNVVNG